MHERCYAMSQYGQYDIVRHIAVAMMFLGSGTTPKYLRIHRVEEARCPKFQILHSATIHRDHRQYATFVTIRVFTDDTPDQTQQIACKSWQSCIRHERSRVWPWLVTNSFRFHWKCSGVPQFCRVA
jgi:hypothetical protein